MNQLLILVSVAVIGSFSVVIYCKSLAALIARMNFEKALMCIRNQQWQLLKNNIKLNSYRWRFAGRPYILIVGLVVRAKLKSHELHEWSEIVNRNLPLKEQYESIRSADDAHLEEWLGSQVRNDVHLSSISNSIMYFVGASIGLTTALVLYIFEG